LEDTTIREHGTAVSTAIAALIFPIVASAASGPAPVCGARDDILNKLASDYREEPASVALTSDGQLLEVLKSDSMMTWSILITNPNGFTCLVVSGEGWQDKINAALEPET